MKRLALSQFFLFFKKIKKKNDRIRFVQSPFPCSCQTLPVGSFLNRYVKHPLWCVGLVNSIRKKKKKTLPYELVSNFKFSSSSICHPHLPQSFLFFCHPHIGFLRCIFNFENQNPPFFIFLEDLTGDASVSVGGTASKNTLPIR